VAPQCNCARAGISKTDSSRVICLTAIFKAN
jgi:hypothetical protein